QLLPAVRLGHPGPIFPRRLQGQREQLRGRLLRSVRPRPSSQTKVQTAHRLVNRRAVTVAVFHCSFPCFVGGPAPPTCIRCAAGPGPRDSTAYLLPRAASISARCAAGTSSRTAPAFTLTHSLPVASRSLPQ